MSSQSSTPVHTSKSSKAKSKTPRSTHGSSSGLTARQQDAQARNKDPYASSSSDSPWEGASRRYDSYGNDSYEQQQKRREAAIVLDSPELLMMHAQARNDSIPGTRHYFTKRLCGYDEEEDANSSKGKVAEKSKQNSSKGEGLNRIQGRYA